MRESMEMIDFKNRLFQFQETQLPERKQILLTVLLILLFCLLLYHGLFRTRWDKEDRFEDQIQKFKAELNSSETVGLTWETLEKQRKLLVDESSTLPLIKVDAESLSVRIRELFQQNSLELEQEDFHQENSRASQTWKVSFIAEGHFKGIQDFLTVLRTMNVPFLISRLQLQNLNVDSPNPFLSIELELTQVA
ncbi:MAG: hypothetical protein VXX42_09015, partial [SAR324 cluster bacterium]|nr:hypothetical protein [SAR324 cluster bacterium]